MPGSLQHIYAVLQQHFGILHDETAPSAWWPIFGDEPLFEMLLGAVLVQQTRWETVEGAIVRLRDANLLAPNALARASADTLASLLRPVAFYTQKAAGIIAISTHICASYDGSMATLLAQPATLLRRELLSLPRIGPETADVIMLYAGNHPVFVVDDYTRRLFGRIAPELSSQPTYAQCFDWQRARYNVVREQIEQELASTIDGSSPTPTSKMRSQESLYADYHALINEQCVRYCLARPRCDGPPARRVYSRQTGRESYLERHDGCPLRPICTFYQIKNEQRV
ncbi:MAG: Fe-S cluster assembly protein HesB [Chloroflexales bacterium]|nr:Fe-S cluster assembly protein HesB [Chloroflexales bacterium]